MTMAYKTMAHINSLNGKIAEVTILKHTKDDKYIVDYCGVKCTAIFNIFTNSYYADDLYGIVKEKCDENRP